MAVDQYCWLSSRQFADIYAIAEAAPGPSSMIVGLLGMGAAVKEGPLWGVLSGLMAEIAILLPSTLLMVGLPAFASTSGDSNTSPNEVTEASPFEIVGAIEASRMTEPMSCPKNEVKRITSPVETLR